MPRYGLGLGLGLTSGGRRAPAWTPTDLGAAVLALFQGSTLASPISAWDDEAPTPHDVVQATAGWRPTLSTIGSSPAAAFDGTDDFLGNSDTLTAPSGKLTLALGYQVTTLPGGSFGGICDFKTSVGTLDVLVMNLGGYTALSFILNTGAMVGANIAYDTNPHAVVIRYKGGAVSSPSSWELDVDGVSVPVVVSGPAGVGSGTALGSRAGGVNYLAVKMAGAALIDDDVGAPTVALLTAWAQGLMT